MDDLKCPLENIRIVVGNPFDAQITSKPNDDRMRGHFFFLARRARIARAIAVRKSFSLGKRGFLCGDILSSDLRKKNF
jgi:hypothetical protein